MRLICHAGPGYTQDYKGAAALPPEAAAAPLPTIPLPPFQATDVAKGTPVQPSSLTLLQRASFPRVRQYCSYACLPVLHGHCFVKYHTLTSAIHLHGYHCGLENSGNTHFTIRTG